MVQENIRIHVFRPKTRSTLIWTHKVLLQQEFPFLWSGNVIRVRLRKLLFACHVLPLLSYLLSLHALVLFGGGFGTFVCPECAAEAMILFRLQRRLTELNCTGSLAKSRGARKLAFQE
jgi:hypothetical protein